MFLTFVSCKGGKDTKEQEKKQKTNTINEIK